MNKFVWIPLALLLAAAPSFAEMALNPDVRQDTIADTICVRGYTKTVRPATSYTNGVKRKLMREAGMDVSQMSKYELDHIVPLALGGHPRKLGNLQLQPWNGPDSAKKKDKLETKLQCMVCAGKLELAAAQRAIYDDWQGAYRQYGKTRCHR
jgi:hypothetical protein